MTLKESVIYHIGDIIGEEEPNEGLIDEVIEAVQEQYPDSSAAEIKEMVTEELEK
jgi:hypothetical protein